MTQFLPQERHFTIGQLAAQWNTETNTGKSKNRMYDTVRRHVKRAEKLGDPVLHIGISGKPGKRKYDPVRIPESTAIRIYNRLTKGGR